MTFGHGLQGEEKTIGCIRQSERLLNEIAGPAPCLAATPARNARRPVSSPAHAPPPRGRQTWQTPVAPQPMGIGFAEHLYSTLPTGTVLLQLTHWKEFHIERSSYALSGDLSLRKNKGARRSERLSTSL